MSLELSVAVQKRFQVKVSVLFVVDHIVVIGATFADQRDALFAAFDVGAWLVDIETRNKVVRVLGCLWGTHFDGPGAVFFGFELWITDNAEGVAKRRGGFGLKHDFQVIVGSFTCVVDLLSRACGDSGNGDADQSVGQRRKPACRIVFTIRHSRMVLR